MKSNVLAFSYIKAQEMNFDFTVNKVKVKTKGMIWKAEFGRELFIWSTMRVFRERLSVCVCSSLPFRFKDGM